MRVFAVSTALVSLLLSGCVSQAESSPKQEPIAAQVTVSSMAKIPVKIQPLPNAIPASDTTSSSVAALPLAPAAQLEVPFTSQAPHKNWDEPYQNACEEASLLTLIHYLENAPFTPELADQEILALTAKTAEMGYGISITMQELETIIRKLYPQYEPTIHTSVTVDSLKALIAQGKPVIIPAAGKALENPYFTGGGPWYHMLVVTGYDDTYFYTNDVGTGHGERYPYPHQFLIDAIHDWVGQDERIAEGRKAMMTLDKK
jgi:hypothetical protein